MRVNVRDGEFRSPDFLCSLGRAVLVGVGLVFAAPVVRCRVREPAGDIIGSEPLRRMRSADTGLLHHVVYFDFARIEVHAA